MVKVNNNYLTFVLKNREISMKRNTISQVLGCALALGTSGAAMAGPEFYGAITYGEAVTSGDDTINYALFDSADTGDFSPLGTRYGNSELAGLKLGLRFDSKLFVELSGNEKNFDGTGFGGNGGTNDCTLAPSAGLISDCFDDAAINFDSKVRSTDLIVGWSFAPSDSWTLQPYAGLRRVEIEDKREIDYLYNQLTGGANDFIVDNSSFKKTGFVIGLRAEKDFGQFFISGDMAYSYASGTRVRSIIDTEYSFDDEDEGDVGSSALSAKSALRHGSIKAIPADAPITDTETSTLREDISVTQWNARFAVGHRFQIAGDNKLSISIGYSLGSVNGFDTRDTNSDVVDEGFTQGSLGERNAKLRSRGADFTLGWNF
jgi:hypothetical protein